MRRWRLGGRSAHGGALAARRSAGSSRASGPGHTRAGLAKPPLVCASHAVVRRNHDVGRPYRAGCCRNRPGFRGARRRRARFSLRHGRFRARWRRFACQTGGTASRCDGNRTRFARTTTWYGESGAAERGPAAWGHDAAGGARGGRRRRGRTAQWRGCPAGRDGRDAICLPRAVGSAPEPARPAGQPGERIPCRLPGDRRLAAVR
jgi:hypothetical protein